MRVLIVISEHPALERWLAEHISDAAAGDALIGIIEGMVEQRIKALRDALEMVRDADDDCRSDGLPTIPVIARVKIDDALKGIVS